MVDITSRPNCRSGQMQEAADDWNLMLRETQHRMKNTLMLLGASVRRDFSEAESKGLSTAVDRFERRIVAFGRLYQLLSSGEDDQTTVVPDYLERLCATLLDSIMEPLGIRCEAIVECGTLPAVQCDRIGLIIAELVTNAAKHAFREEDAALIRVEALNRNGVWSFTVADNGAGAKGSLQSTGGQIVQCLARSLGAKVLGRTGQDGTTVTIVLPAST